MDVMEKSSNGKRLIDVNKVINSMQKCLDESPDKKHSVAYFAFETIIECLKQEPTVDAVEVVHGRWLCVDTDTEHFFLCNRCKKKEFLQSNYCRSCGAMMDGGAD